MRKMMVILVVGLIFVGVVLGDDNTQTQLQQTNVQSNQNTVVQGPGYSEGGDASAGASAGAYSGIYWDYSPTSIMRYPEYKVPLVSFGFPQPPWWMPGENQIALWNTTAADLRFYEGTYTRKQVETALKKSGKWFTELGAGFEWFVTLKNYDYEPTDSIEVKLVDIKIIKDGRIQIISSAPYELIQKDYTFFGDIPVKGTKHLNQFLVFMWALKLAMDHGAQFATLNPGMNVVYQGVNFSPGVGFGTAGTHNSFSVISGLASTEAKAQAEPVIKLAVFTKNGTGISLPSPKEEKEKEVEEERGKKIKGVPVSPEILGKAGYGGHQEEAQDDLAAVRERLMRIIQNSPGF